MFWRTHLTTSIISYDVMYDLISVPLVILYLILVFTTCFLWHFLLHVNFLVVFSCLEVDDVSRPGSRLAVLLSQSKAVSLCVNQDNHCM